MSDNPFESPQPPKESEMNDENNPLTNLPAPQVPAWIRMLHIPPERAKDLLFKRLPSGDGINHADGKPAFPEKRRKNLKQSQFVPAGEFRSTTPADLRAFKSQIQEEARPFYIEDYWNLESCPDLRFLLKQLFVGTSPPIIILRGLGSSGKTSLSRSAGGWAACVSPGRVTGLACGQCAGCREVIHLAKGFDNLHNHRGYVEINCGDHRAMGDKREFNGLLSIRDRKPHFHTKRTTYEWFGDPRDCDGVVEVLNERPIVVAFDNAHNMQKNDWNILTSELEEYASWGVVTIFSTRKQLAIPRDIRNRAGTIYHITLPTVDECINGMQRVTRRYGLDVPESLLADIARSAQVKDPAAIEHNANRKYARPRQCLEMLRQVLVIDPEFKSKTYKDLFK